MLEGYCFNTLNSIPLTLKLGIEIESSSPGFVLRQGFFFEDMDFKFLWHYFFAIM